MTKKEENQSKNLEKNQLSEQLESKADPEQLIASLRECHTKLADLKSALEEIFEQINLNSIDVEAMRYNLDPMKTPIWDLRMFKHNLSFVLLLAMTKCKTQYLQLDEHMIEITRVEDKDGK